MHFILGINEAIEELQFDYTNCLISKLCVRREGRIEVVCFTVASPLLSFAWKFHEMHKERNSVLFLRMWQDNVKKALARCTNLNIGDIEKEVWMPTFQYCQALLNQLENMSIALCDVNHLLASDCELEYELKALSLGVSTCNGGDYCSNEWIPSVLSRIKDYNKLHNYCAAANIFIDLRNSLQLQGDFKDVESIAAEV